MSAQLDYYAVLGVQRTADDKTIKKAYRALALKWHPDKNPGNVAQAEAKFKEIGEAFSVLSDTSKRAAYDRGTTEYDDARGQHHSSFFDTGPTFARNNQGAGSGGGGHHHFSRSNAFDIFRQFFGGHDPFEAMHAHHAAVTQQMFGGGFGFGAPFGGGMFGGHGGGMGMMGMGSPFQSMGLMHADPFFGGHGMGMGMGGMFQSMSGGGMGVSSSTSTSSHTDSLGRMITQTTRTVTENGQSSTTVTTRIQHPDGRVETSEEHNGVPRQLPAGNGRMDAQPPPAQAARSQRSAPIDLAQDESDDDEVQEIPAPRQRRSQPRASRHAHSQSAVPQAATQSFSAAPSFQPAQSFQPASTFEPSARFQAAQSFQSTSAAASAPGGAPFTGSNAAHQRSSTISFGTHSGFTQEQLSAQRALQRQQEAQHAAIAAREHERHVAAAAAAHADAVAAHHRTFSQPTMAQQQRFGTNGSTGTTPRSATAASATAFNFTASQPPPPLSSTARGVSDVLLQQRAERDFEELYASAHRSRPMQDARTRL